MYWSWLAPRVSFDWYVHQVIAAIKFVKDFVNAARGISKSCLLAISEERVLCVRDSGEMLIDLRRGKVVAQRWTSRRLRLRVEIDRRVTEFSFKAEWREEAEMLAASLGATV